MTFFTTLFFLGVVDRIEGNIVIAEIHSTECDHTSGEEIVEIDLPEEYKCQDWFSKWEEHYADRWPEAIECVRKKHNSIKYDDNAHADLHVKVHKPDNKEE